MRDLLAEVWKRQRETQQPKTPGTPQPSRRNSSVSKLLVLGILGALVLGAGAIPLALQWSGSETESLSFERALGLMSDDATKTDSMSSLQARLLPLAEDGVRAMSRLAKTRPAQRQLVQAGFNRLRTRLDGTSVPPVARPDFPTWLQFETALETLEGVEPGTTSAQLEQSLEVLIHNIEQMIAMSHARARDDKGPVGRSAGGMLARLRSTLDMQ